MEKRIPYYVTVIISLLCIFVGHGIAVNGLPVFHDNSQVLVRAAVQKILARDEPDEFIDEYIPMQTRIYFEAKVTGDKGKGETIIAMQSTGGFSMAPAKEVSPGDRVLLVRFVNEDQWHFSGYARTDKLLILGILFTLSLLIFGGKKGFNTILSLGLTCGAIFAVLIPSILSGKNIYLMSMLVCIYTVIMTLTIVIGFNKKAFTAAAGCLSGIAITGLITIIMDRVLFLTGVIDENSRYLASLPLTVPINLRAIIFAGITIGAMGAIMDVAMSISSSLWEIKEKAETIKFDALFRSGLTIGRDIMGSMANTLILAYIGTSLSVVLLLSVYSSSLLGLFNREMIVVEILQALVGSFGILFTMPLTALICSAVYLKKK